MDKRTKNQNRRLHKLLDQLMYNEEMKASLIDIYTHGRTVHSSDMSVMECQELINYLGNKVNEKEFAKDKQRKRVIANLKSAGMDMAQVHAWVKQQNKKHLNDHTEEELSKLIYAAEKVKQHYYSKI